MKDNRILSDQKNIRKSSLSPDEKFMKEALREAGRIGQSRLDWGWIISRVFFGLLILLAAALLAYGVSQMNGCGANGGSTDVKSETP